MRTVTKENLIAQIDRLRKIKDEQGQLSMSGEYTLQAYEMLLATIEAEPVAEITEDLGRLFVKIHCPTTLKAGDKLYCHAQPATAVPEEMTAGIAVKHWQGGRGSIESFVAGCNFFRAAILSQK